MAKALKVVGLMNVQFAIQGDVSDPDDAVVYVLEVNPRASRTVPFVSKATGQPLAKIAARCMAGQRLNDQRGAKGQMLGEVIPPYFSIKEAVFPFNKFPGVDPILGPEMRSTGEVMGVGKSFGEAMLKSQLGAGSRLPTKGTVVISVKNNDKDRAVKVASELVDLGFQIAATRGTAAAIAAAGRAPAYRRQGQGRRDPARLHHSRRDAHGHCRLAPHPHRGHRQPGDLLHHDGRLRGRHRGAEAPGRPHGLVAAGIARRTALNWPHDAPAGCVGVFSHAPRARFLFAQDDPMATIPLTHRGAELLKSELQRLKSVERHAVIQAISEARGQGDLSENAEYEAAKDKQGFIEGRIAEIEGKLAAAQVIDPSKVDAGGRVVFGATVDLEEENGGHRVTYQIVGDDEADLKQGLISISSPIARALIGKESGDVAEVQAPGGNKSYEIVDVRYV
jgi:transcription elongation factor GreA